MRRNHVVVGAVLCLAVLAAGGYAVQSQSASYTAQPQAITQGAGASSSTSYSSPQQALGPMAGFHSSASYSASVGAVQPPSSPPEPTSVNEWELLDN